MYNDITFMKYSKNTIFSIILVILFIASFALPGAISTEIGEIVSRVYTKNEESASTTAPLVVEKTIDPITVDSVLKEREVRLSALVRKDLLGSFVTKDQYGIVEDGVDSHLVVDVGQLLKTKNWKEFGLGENGLVFKYPSEGWYIYRDTTKSRFVLTTTKTGVPEGNKPWAKIIAGEYERGGEMSLLDWMKQNSKLKSGAIPPSDMTTQYVTIGGSVFLGSIFFKDNLWFGKKNVYAEISPVHIFAGTLEVKNMNATSENIGKFDQVFYTMMETLEVKQTQTNE